MRWNPRLFVLFFAPYLLAVAAVTVTVAGYADRALEQQHLRTLGDEVLRAATLAGNALPWQLRGDEFDARCRELGQQSGARITVIALDGTVLCDSQAASVRMENHLLRPEVQQAVHTGSGVGIRRSRTIHQQLFYRAYQQQAGTTARIVRLAVPVGTLTQAQQHIRYILLLSLLIAAGIGLWPAVRLSRWLSRRIEAMGHFSQAVAADQPPPPMSPERADELGRLEANLATMAIAVRERLRTTREEEQKLRAVLAGMAEGVVAVDRRGDLILLNDRACEIFGLDPRAPSLGRPLVQICRDPELQGLVRDTIAMGPETAPLSREITLAGEGPRALAVNAAPVHGDREALGYVLVFRDISELKRLEAVRRDFVANVSHELRTPLTAIRGYAETLVEGTGADPEESRKFLGVIARNADRLTRLIDDLLTLSDLELGRTGLQRSAVPVATAVAAACDIVAERARRQGVTLRHDHLEEVPPLYGDPDRIEQVFVNIIDNAVKYTHSGGVVTVSAQVLSEAESGGAVKARVDADGWVEVAVTDTGIGIPAPDLARITERFYRVDKARSRELGGTGLGLAIVKHIVQAHGGWMRIESVLGRGTTVRVVFPAAVAPLTASPSADK